MEDFARISAFMLEIDRLKDVLRKTKPLAVDRPENSAEHSWQVALLATLLASNASERVDVGRVVEMLLVHDIPEIEIGDVIVYAQHDPERDKQEAAAAHALFEMLPEPQASHCFDLWLEYEQRLTAEARYAYAVDRLMPVLHNLQRNGGTWREYGISLDQVLEVNAVTGEALPEVWAQVQAQVIACFTAMDSVGGTSD
ncbi:MAG: HD domain-containing protein [Actinomycetota bacterium]|nr:HD domain-containing protein [Actinomycetota bacterium]